MTISSKLESMVADLVSDERQKREEVEAVLSQIHQLTEGYFHPQTEVSAEEVEARFPGTISQPAEPQQDVDSLDAQFSNMVQYNMRRNGDSKEDAERKAKLALGIE